MLGQHLVHRAGAGEHAGAGVGDPQDLEQLLHGAVLAVAAVHGDERGVRTSGAQLVDQVGADVDRHDLVAQPLERVLDPRARPEGDLPLERAAALQDGDAAHFPRARPWPERLVGMCTISAPSPSGSTGARFGAPSPVSVPYSATCSATTLPIRRTPSRISSSSTAEKLSRIALWPRPSRYAAAPGTNATLSRSARASRSVVSMKSGSVSQSKRPPFRCVHSACSGKCSASASSIVSRRAR